MKQATVLILNYFYHFNQMIEAVRGKKRFSLIASNRCKMALIHDNYFLGPWVQLVWFWGGLGHRQVQRREVLRRCRRLGTGDIAIVKKVHVSHRIVKLWLALVVFWNSWNKQVYHSWWLLCYFDQNSWHSSHIKNFPRAIFNTILLMLGLLVLHKA